jgi:hypothetical protein
MSPRGTVVNQLLQTDGLIVSPWANNPSFTTLLGGQADPFGGTGATRITESVDGSAQAHFVYQTQPASLRGAPQICTSVFFLPGARSCVNLAPNGGGNAIGFDCAALAVIGTNGTLATQGVTAGVEVVQGAPAWRRCWAIHPYTPNASIETRFYVSSVYSAANYQGNGSVAGYFFGAMAEVVVPNQTTPSPYVASGATSGVGRRDNRQNMLKGSGSPSFTYFSPSTGDSVATGVADPDGGSTAVAYTYGTATASYAYLSQTVAGADASRVWTLSMWLRVPSGTKALSLCLSNLTVATVYKAITVTTTWQRFSFTLTERQLAATANGLGVGLAGAAAGDVFHVCRMQLEQANAPGPYVATTSAPFNPNGAPRSLVL